MKVPYDPRSLPEVDAVELVDLGGVDVRHVGEYMSACGDSPRIKLTGDQAELVAELWRSLPPGEQSRCHNPPYGLRFLNNVEVVCQASVCWRCDNLFGDAAGADIHYEFDSQHATSRQLLEVLREAAATAGWKKHDDEPS